MGTEIMESDRKWSSSIHGRGPSWEKRLGGLVLACAVAFAAGVALENQEHERANEARAEKFAKDVSACELSHQTPVASKDGKITCHMLMPRFAMPVEPQPSYKPTRRELRRMLRATMRGDQSWK